MSSRVKKGKVMTIKMHHTLTKRLAAASLAVLAILTGCSGATKKPASPTAQAESVTTKPPLKIPASFADDKTKQAFAVKAIKDGYFAEAKPLLEQVAASATDAVTFVALGTSRFNTEDYAGAISAWSKAAEVDPKLAGEMQNNIGNALRESRKLEEAKTAYRKALQGEPTRYSAAINLATMLKSEGKLPEAMNVLNDALTANKDVAPLKALLASYKTESKANVK